MKAWLWLLVSTVAMAQDLQNRSVVHITADLNDHWFIPVWSITNLKSQTADNTNIFSGLGYRGRSWWLEGMVQKQWNPNGGFWAADVRLLKKFGKRQKTLVYFEPAPFLSQKGFYWFLYGETQVWHKLAIGAETENVHKPGPDVATLGPRVSRGLGRFAGFDVSAAGAFRFDPLQQPTKIRGHPHEIRLYLVLTKRFALADLK